jgi:predicted ABC-type transport system involved in lysophospholipase L1 biosynthesis ATPase subunit
MSIMNDYTFQTLNDQRERELAELAANNRRVRLALSGRVSWWRRVLSRRGQRRIAIARPEHRVAH